MASTAVPAERLSYSEARHRVLAAAPKLAQRLGREELAIDNSLGRVLASPLIANTPFPRFDNSAVDGYAVLCDDIAGASQKDPVRLEILETVAAGREPNKNLIRGKAIRVMTGAPLPSGTECVVMREDTEEKDDEVWVQKPGLSGDNVRPAGEDAPAGETVLEQGKVLAPGDIAALAAFGHARVQVVIRPRVAILSTGDELREPGEGLDPGQIYDSNSHTLRALIDQAGAQTSEVARVPDDPTIVEKTLQRLLAENDMVISLGGVSAGDFDVVKQVLPSFSQIQLWRVGMRPGGPQAFGSTESSVFYGLPGNPVSSAVVFDRLARPLIRTALGAKQVERAIANAEMLDATRSRPGRRDFLRVRLMGSPGSYKAKLTGTQSSGAVTSLAKADGLAVVPEDLERVSAGTELEVILWQDV